MSLPRITLEQWQALTAVVEAGGYARAAEAIHKSQSTLTYAVQRIEALLGVKLFERQGRKAVLTATGRLLFQRARALVDEAGLLEHSARALSAGWEAEITLAVEMIFPNWLLLECFEAFGAESPHTRIELIESVIGGTPEAIEQGTVNLAITARVPEGFPGEPLMRVRFVAAAHPEHPLNRLGRKLSFRDLRAHRHLVVRDTGSARSKLEVSIDAAQRWTVSQLATSIEAARLGMGFAWFPEERIRFELAQGLLKPLPLAEGAQRYAQLYLVVADRELAGPGVSRLAMLIREAVARSCPDDVTPATSRTSARPRRSNRQAHGR
ncbi:MAG: LysR family transcriptional regulator [Betaproteobacteria bacterium]|nr:MAG: LysR family transcriptional regulator [Betaproteobacteria bacterium]